MKHIGPEQYQASSIARMRVDKVLRRNRMIGKRVARVLLRPDGSGTAFVMPSRQDDGQFPFADHPTHGRIVMMRRRRLRSKLTR